MPSGLSYKAMRVGNGRKAQDGEWVQLSLVMKVAHRKDEKGKQTGKDKKSKQERILMNSFSEPQPFLIELGGHLKKTRMAEMIGMVEERQHMVFKCSPKYYLGEEHKEHLEEVLKTIDLKIDDELVVDIKVDKIMTKEERIQMIETQRIAQLEKDKQMIIDHLAAHNITASLTNSGLFYTIDLSSEDIAVVQNKTVKVNYTGRLLDGTIFDTSLEEVAKTNNCYNARRAYQPIEFQVGVGHVIAGWDEGLLLLKKNEKARFFIPSSLAYGTEGAGAPIPANSVLIFEVEVVDVR
jgi:FKBP-type peptidyl-prolyl cis-trans isomerase